MNWKRPANTAPIVAGRQASAFFEKATSHNHATVGQGAVVNDAKMTYNGFGQLTKEQQQHGGAIEAGSPKVEYTYFGGADNLLGRRSIVYPDGNTYNYEYGSTSSDDYALARVAHLADSASMRTPEYVYLGLTAVVRTEAYSSGGSKRVIHDLVLGSNSSNPYGGLDQFGRIKELVWRTEHGTPADLERLEYGYDRASNRTYRKNVLAGGAALQDELYAYDGAHRLKDFDRGTLNSTNTALTTTALNQDWTLDPTGNWSQWKQTVPGASSQDVDQMRTSNPVNEVAWRGPKAATKQISRSPRRRSRIHGNWIMFNHGYRGSRGSNKRNYQRYPRYPRSKNLREPRRFRPLVIQMANIHA